MKALSSDFMNVFKYIFREEIIGTVLGYEFSIKGA
jgi:hypothetical protein